MSGRRRGALACDPLQRVLAEHRRANERGEARALASRLNETADLARARGETVAQGAAGRLRITSRDGLMTLFERGAIDRAEHEAGLLYRRCYETLEGGPRSNLNRDFIGAGGPGEADGFAALRAMRAQRLARWEALAGGRRGVWILRLVAGQARTINQVASGGSARLANTRALKAALEAIAIERGLIRRAPELSRSRA